MSDINQNVNINVNANTQDASRDVERLENNIKTLDGAINLVGGSIEVLAGALAISGAVSEEQAEKFQSAAVGAIALADGSKRIIEGYKTLATETKVLTVVQRIYNTVMAANPLFLIVGVIAAVTLGVIALTKALKDQREEQEKINALESDQAYLRFQERSLALAQIRGESAVQLAKRQEEIAKNQLDIARQQKEIAQGTEDEAEAVKTYDAAWDNYIITRAKVTAAEKKAAEDEAAAQKKKLEDLETERQKQLALRKTAIAEEKKLEQEAFDQFEENYNKRIAKEKELMQTRINADIARAKAAKDARDAEIAAEEKAEAAKQAMITGGIDNIQGALGALFGENKAVASANVLIDAAQAGVGIIKNSQSTGPLAIAYQASQFALLAATTAASLQQINSTEPGSTGGSNTPRSGGVPTTGGAGLSGPGFNLGVPQIGGTSGVNTISAVVLAGDVTSAQAQDAAIRNRRRFG